jgi:hypothetical protein
MNLFHGKPARDNVKVEIAQDNGSSLYYFARCEAFFQDSKGRTYVGLRWYDQSGPDIIDGTVLLPKLKLRPHDQPRSYSVLPSSCIANGALVIAHGAAQMLQIWRMHASTSNMDELPAGGPSAGTPITGAL